MFFEARKMHYGIITKNVINIISNIAKNTVFRSGIQDVYQDSYQIFKLHKIQQSKRSVQKSYWKNPRLGRLQINSSGKSDAIGHIWGKDLLSEIVKVDAIGHRVILHIRISSCLGPLKAQTNTDTTRRWRFCTKSPVQIKFLIGHIWDKSFGWGFSYLNPITILFR